MIHLGRRAQPPLGFTRQSAHFAAVCALHVRDLNPRQLATILCPQQTLSFDALALPQFAATSTATRFTGFSQTRPNLGGPGRLDPVVEQIHASGNLVGKLFDLAEVELRRVLLGLSLADVARNGFAHSLLHQITES